MSLRMAITGSSGMIGSCLRAYFTSRGDCVLPLVRSRETMPPPASAGIRWDIPSGMIEADKLEGADVVVNLAGANIAARRWTVAYKNIIRNSRVESTRLLCRTLAKLKRRPGLLISASAVGFYGNHDAFAVVDESSPRGTGFLADVCEQWEKETVVASEAGICVVNARFGVVLGTSGGALAKMLPFFKLGLGGVLGDGSQPMSWIALDEIPSIMDFCIRNGSVRGPLNFVAPNPVSNREFTRILGKVLRRPTIFPTPAPAVRILFGEMGQSLLLEGVRAAPGRLTASGYAFQFPDLEPALRKALGR